jgi:TatD DNase family protein
MYFDSHCHLTDQRLAGDSDAVVARARAAGVSAMVTIASDEQDAVEALRLATALGLHSTAGIHPHQADRPDQAFQKIRELAEDPRVVAVGETGLDYHYDHAPRARQRELFIRHLELGAATGLPVVVHSRDADEDTAAIIREAPRGVSGVLHCFAGGRNLFETAVTVGWYISFSGLITFPRYENADLVTATPSDRLLIETDSPYLAPVPYRGRRNEPAYVVDVARRAAELRGDTLHQVAAQTSRNARAFYSLPEPVPGSGSGGGVG